MINYKDFNVKYIGGLIITGVVLLLIVALFVHVVGPILHMILPMVFGETLSVTEALLLLILISLHSK